MCNGRGEADASVEIMKDRASSMERRGAKRAPLTLGLNVPVKRHRGEAQPGGHTRLTGHTGHTGARGHTDHTDEPVQYR